MARHKDLKNILQGMISSFISRNNDLNGYWATGKIYKTAVEHKMDMVHFDLLGSISSIDTTELNQLALIWTEKFDVELTKYNIPENWIRSAKITANFTSDVQNMEVWGIYPGGDLGKYTFEIKTDTGSIYSQARIVKCRHHDPSKERSSR